MSSATSTDGGVRLRNDAPEASVFRPWHFFVILTMLAATAAVLTAKRTTPEYLILLSLVCFAAGGVTLAVYRTLLPLAGRDRLLRGETLSHRARAEMEREKQLVLRSIKELEFDRAMGKLAESDFAELTARLRARALRLMQQLDADEAAPRERIEAELAARLREPASGAGTGAAAGTAGGRIDAEEASTRNRTRSCGNCGAANDEDARFCKACGTPFGGAHA